MLSMKKSVHVLRRFNRQRFRRNMRANSQGRARRSARDRHGGARRDAIIDAAYRVWDELQHEPIEPQRPFSQDHQRGRPNPRSPVYSNAMTPRIFLPARRSFMASLMSSSLYFCVTSSSSLSVPASYIDKSIGIASRGFISP